MQSKQRVAVVGGGFAGLAAALRLAEENVEVEVFEKLPEVGGLAAGFKEPGWNTTLEKYYHHWFASDACVKRLARDLGVESKLIFRKPLSVMETSKGEFRALDSAVALLLYDDLSFVDRVRMGMCLAYLKTTSDWRSLEKETAKDWCEKWMGVAGFTAIWKQLLEGKFGAHANEVNMAWLWARLKSRTASLGTFEGGFQAFVDVLAKKIESLGGQVKTNCGDLQFKFEGGKWYANQKTYDALVVAASPMTLQKVVSGVAVETQKKGLFLGAQVIILTLTKPMTAGHGPYWYSLRKSGGKSFLALVDHAQFVPASEFGGEHPVYIADYVDTQSREWQRSDDELIKLALERVQLIAPHIQSSDVKMRRVFRESYAQPIPLRHASENLPSIEVQGAQGLFHASLAHVYPWDRGTNFAIELGETVAERVLGYLKK